MDEPKPRREYTAGLRLTLPGAGGKYKRFCIVSRRSRVERGKQQFLYKLRWVVDPRSMGGGRWRLRQANKYQEVRLTRVPRKLCFVRSAEQNCSFLYPPLRHRPESHPAGKQVDLPPARQLFIIHNCPLFVQVLLTPIICLPHLIIKKSREKKDFLRNTK